MDPLGRTTVEDEDSGLAIRTHTPRVGGHYQRNRERLSANTLDEEVLVVVAVPVGLSLATEMSEGGRGGGDSSGERATLTVRILAG